MILARCWKGVAVPRSAPCRLRSVAAAAIGAALALPSAAQARTFFSFGFGFPGFYAGPPAFYYYPPPVSPPPVYLPPPPLYAPPPPPPVTYLPQPDYGPAPFPSAGRCYAGAYVCPPERPGPAGAPCSCPTNTGRARGRIG
jgi:hypothetical protein